MRLLGTIDLSLSRVRPLWFLALYFLAIPLFAALYTSAAPHGFYAPYSDKEPSAYSDTEALALTLQRSLNRGMDMHSDSELTFNGWTVKRRSVSVGDVRSHDGNFLSFGVYFRATAKDFIGSKMQEHLGAGTRGPLFVAISRDPNEISEPTGTQPSFFIRHPIGDYGKDPNLMAVASVLFNGPHAPHSYGSTIGLTALENRQLILYLQGQTGDPLAVSGQYWRMLYLSAVVLTTLGLGDIIPVSSEARFLVACEAVLGIGLAGLFLNALAYRASGSTKTN